MVAAPTRRLDLLYCGELRKRACTASGRRLVRISPKDEIAAAGPDVSDVERHVSPDRMLDVDIPMLHVTIPKV
jgi:hypothetical protein